MRQQTKGRKLTPLAVFPQLVDYTHRSTGLTRQKVRHVLDVFFMHAAVELVHGSGRVNVPKVGTWRLKTRKARRIMNPVTRELMQLQATRSVGFRGSKVGFFATVLAAAAPASKKKGKR